MCKKVVPLMALLVSVFIVPAPATASWQFEEVPIAGDTFEIHGQFKSESQQIGGGIECTVQAHVALEPGTTTAKASQFEVKGQPTEKCKGFFGLAFCQVHGATFSGLPLTLHITETSPATISITTGNVQYTTTGGFCPIATFTLTAGTITATPDNANAMKQLTLSESLTAHSSEVTGQAKMSGTLKVTPEGIYGI